MNKYIFILLTILISVSPVLACQYKDGLPDPYCTPGNTFQGVTKETVCVKGYTSTVRYVPEKVKKEVYQSYRTSKESDYCPCEVDHFIPLCLGGSNNISNLWLESYQGRWSARMKDKLEAHLWREVCKNKITLAKAQEAIRTDWRKAYIDHNLHNKGNQGTVVENVE